MALGVPLFLLLRCHSGTQYVGVPGKPEDSAGGADTKVGIGAGAAVEFTSTPLFGLAALAAIARTA